MRQNIMAVGACGTAELFTCSQEAEQSQNFTIFVKFNLPFPFFLLMPVLLMPYLKNHCQIQAYEGSPMFYFKGCIVF
jgi:hypothetical protein